MHPPGAQVHKSMHQQLKCAHRMQGAPLISNTVRRMTINTLCNATLQVLILDIYDNIHVEIRCALAR